MGAESFVKKWKYGIIIGCIVVSAVIITGVSIVQTQNHEVPVFSNTEYNVKSYPYYFRAAFEVLERPGLDAYLRIQLECQGLSETEGIFLSFMIFRGDVSVLDTYHDPGNSTVRWWMSQDGLTLLRSAGTTRTSYTWPMDLVLEPGKYVWVHFIESQVNVTAQVFSVTVTIVYR